MKPIIRMALRIPSAIPAANRLLQETRSAESVFVCSAMVLNRACQGLLLLHENLREIVMLLKDRHDLVDQRLDVIVASILALLLQLAHELFVIGTGLFEKHQIELDTIRGAQLLINL